MTQSLWDAPSWFAAIVESSTDAVLGQTLDGTITSCNPAAELLYGYGAAEMVGQPVAMLLPESQLAEEAALMARLTRGEGVASHQAERITKQGRHFWVALSLAPVRDGAGQIIAAASIAHDITARVRSELAVRTSGERYRALLDATPDATMLMDMQGVILTASAQAAELFGADSAEELEGQNALTLFEGRNLEAAQSAFDAIGRDGVVSGLRTSQMQVDGTTRHFEISGGLLEGDGGKPLGMVGITRDITRFVIAETALGASQERLQLALQAAQLETWDWDTRTGGGWSTGLPGLLGHPPTASIHSHQEFFQHLHAADRGAVERWVEGIRVASSQGGLGAVAMDFRIVASDDAVRWVQAHAQVLANDDGMPPRIVGVAQDITARKASEAQHDANMQTEKLRALGQMASGVAHDLNQSLAIVAGYADIARQELTSLAAYPGTLAQALDMIAKAGLDGGKTVERLLTFGKPQPQGPSAPVDVANLLRDVAALTAPRWRDAAQAEGRHINVVVETGGASIFVRGWVSSLREALTNLVFNAEDALRQGGSITLRARRLGSSVVISVSDTGSGMSAEVSERVFEPYFTTKGERGTGLGLAQVYGIVQQHHGQVAIESEIGQGTTFRITLPISEGPGPTAAAEEPEAGAGLRVLVVDDDATLLRMASIMLRGDGHAVRTALSAEIGLELLETEAADVLVSDLGLGDGMNGWDLASAVRSRWPKMRVVLATGWGAAFSAEEAAARGVDHVLPKPYLMGALQRAVSPGGTAAPHA